MDGTPFGRYRLVSPLGRGGMGEVWRAYDTGTDRVVALKVLPTHVAQDPLFEQRFRREAHLAARLHNPHVVPIHDYGEIDGRLFLDMALIEGRDLAAMIADGPLDPEQAVAIVEQVAGALNAAHRAGLVHRDVKPSNILIDEDDYAYLIDFGIARGAADTTKLTGTGATIGTWAYMAPERFTTDQISPRCDIYALACVLHEALTGDHPYPGGSLERQVAGHLTAPPPRPSMMRPDVPDQFDDVIATGMAKDPGQRYQSARDLAQAARQALTRTAPPTQPPKPPKPPNPQPPGPAPEARKTDVDRTVRRPADQEATRKAALLKPATTAPTGPGRRRVGVWIAAAAGVLAIVIGASVALMQQGHQSPSSGSSSPNSGTPTRPVLTLTVAASSNAAINAANVGDCIYSSDFDRRFSSVTMPAYGTSAAEPTASPGSCSPGSGQDYYWKVVRRTHDINDCRSSEVAAVARDTGLVLCLVHAFGTTTTYPSSATSSYPTSSFGSYPPSSPASSHP